MLVIGKKRAERARAEADEVARQLAMQKTRLDAVLADLRGSVRRLRFEAIRGSKGNRGKQS